MPIFTGLCVRKSEYRLNCSTKTGGYPAQVNRFAHMGYQCTDDKRKSSAS